MPTSKFTKLNNSLSHILLQVFCLHFLRTHHGYFFRRCFESVQAHFLSGNRSSRSEVFLVKGVLKMCSTFTGEHPCRSVILIKLLCNFTEITLWHGCSPANLLHIFRTSFPRKISGWLLLRTFERKVVFLVIYLFSYNSSFLHVGYGS